MKRFGRGGGRRQHSTAVESCLTLAVLALVLAGTASCAGNIPGNPTSMSPEQLKEWIKDKNANVGCAVVNSPYGKGNGVFVVLDKGIVLDGSLTVSDACQITITNTNTKKKE